MARQMESRIFWFEAVSPLISSEIVDVLVDATPSLANDDGAGIEGVALGLGVATVVGLDVAGIVVGLFVGSDVVLTEGGSVRSDVVRVEVLGEEVVGSSVLGRSVGE